MTDAKQKLIRAEQQAKKLFNAVEQRGLIMPGKRESQLAAEVVELAREFGIETFWHKKIVRTGINTLHSYSGDPPDLVIQNDDILFLDFGPIFDGWEADLGRTYVIGDDPLKVKLKADVEAAWYEAAAWHAMHDSLTGSEYFNYAVELAKKYRWEFGGEIAGHIVGHYPHEQLGPGNLGLDVHPGNHSDIFERDRDRNPRYWILELQFVDREKQIGAFFEQLLPIS